MKKTGNSIDTPKNGVWKQSDSPKTKILIHYICRGTAVLSILSRNFLSAFTVLTNVYTLLLDHASTGTWTQGLTLTLFQFQLSW